jgi:hypothetical protein
MAAGYYGRRTPTETINRRRRSTFLCLFADSNSVRKITYSRLRLVFDVSFELGWPLWKLEATSNVETKA